MNDKNFYPLKPNKGESPTTFLEKKSVQFKYNTNHEEKPQHTESLPFFTRNSSKGSEPLEDDKKPQSYSLCLC